MKLHEKTVLNCITEEAEEKHNEELEKIFMGIEELSKYGVIVHIENKEKDEFIYIEDFEIHGLSEIGDKKNGIDFKFDDNNLIQINYGEEYTVGDTNIKYYFLNKFGKEKLERSIDIDEDIIIENDYFSLYFNSDDFVSKKIIETELEAMLKPKQSLLEKAPAPSKNKEYER